MNETKAVLAMSAIKEKCPLYHTGVSFSGNMSSLLVKSQYFTDQFQNILLLSNIHIPSILHENKLTVSKYVSFNYNLHAGSKESCVFNNN